MTISSSVGSNQPSYPRSEGEASSRMRSRPPGHFAPTSFSRAGRPLVTCRATKSAPLRVVLEPVEQQRHPGDVDDPLVGARRVAQRDHGPDPPSGEMAAEVWVVWLPCSVLVKSSLVESKVIDDGATTSTMLRPESPTP